MHPPSRYEYYTRPLNIDISNKCKLACPVCDRQVDPSMVARAKDISLDDFQKLVDVFSNISICGQISDPIYHPKFIKLLELAKPLELLTVSTNGSGKTEKWWRSAFQQSIDNGNIIWRFALDGLPEESHIYRVGQDGLHVWEMMKLGVEMGADIHWQYIPFLYNQDHVEQARKMAEENGIKFFLKISSRHPEGMTPTRKEYAIERIRVAD
jgi:MoaA/NifB/PqqE/SkfB family radical SAM enzyme